jgi:nucleoporin SEH1
MSFDFYGSRLATCSSDRKIKIWEQIGGDWKLQYEWNAHQASVWKIAWAHPEFGQILASCSFDRTVCIWEDQGAPLHATGNSNRENWRSQAQLVDSRESVHDIKFAPRHLGLRLVRFSWSAPQQVFISSLTPSLRYAVCTGDRFRGRLCAHVRSH